jgi:hypothetical protein
MDVASVQDMITIKTEPMSPTTTIKTSKYDVKPPILPMPPLQPMVSASLVQKGVLPRSVMDRKTRDLLRLVETWPLTMTKALPGVGHVQIRIWNSSRLMLAGCNFEITTRVKYTQGDADLIIEDLHDEDFDSDEIAAIKSQLRMAEFDVLRRRHRYSNVATMARATYADFFDMESVYENFSP